MIQATIKYKKSDQGGLLRVLLCRTNLWFATTYRAGIRVSTRPRYLGALEARTPPVAQFSLGTSSKMMVVASGVV